RVLVVGNPIPATSSEKFLRMFLPVLLETFEEIYVLSGGKELVEHNRLKNVACVPEVLRLLGRDRNVIARFAAIIVLQLLFSLSLLRRIRHIDAIFVLPLLMPLPVA